MVVPVIICGKCGKQRLHKAKGLCGACYATQRPGYDPKKQSIRIAECTYCKRERPIKGNGLCSPCYQRWKAHGTCEYQRWGTAEGKKCVQCGKDMKKMAANGLCPACYYREKKNGSFEYKRKGKRSICSVEGCDGWAKSNGLCDVHRQRLVSRGSVDYPVMTGAGSKRKHPMYLRWRHILQAYDKEVVSEWKENFWKFIADIGDPPSDQHKIFVYDPNKPLGPRNFIWRKNVMEIVDGESLRDYHARKRVPASMTPEGQKAHTLRLLARTSKIKMGLDLNIYNEMLERQGGVCAICGEEETTVSLGKRVSLAVDHCHETKEIRGLLCKSCNQGLGHFKDDIALLESAISYLKKSRLKEAA